VSGPVTARNFIAVQQAATQACVMWHHCVSVYRITYKKRFEKKE